MFPVHVAVQGVNCCVDCAFGVWIVCLVCVDYSVRTLSLSPFEHGLSVFVLKEKNAILSGSRGRALSQPVYVQQTRTLTERHTTLSQFVLVQKYCASQITTS